MILDRLPDPVKHFGDAAAAAVAGASFLSHEVAAVMPTVGLILSSIYALIRIYETRTVQGAIAKLRAMGTRP